MAQAQGSQANLHRHTQGACRCDTKTLTRIFQQHTNTHTCKQITNILTAAFKEPFDLSEMVRLTFTVGGGKLVRTRYDDNMPVRESGGDHTVFVCLRMCFSLEARSARVIFVDGHRRVSMAE